jgi:hypothetical protein
MEEQNYDNQVASYSKIEFNTILCEPNLLFELQLNNAGDGESTASDEFTPGKRNR